MNRKFLLDGYFYINYPNKNISKKYYLSEAAEKVVKIKSIIAYSMIKLTRLKVC